MAWAMLVVVLLVVCSACATVTVDGESTSLPLPVAGPVKCASKTVADLGDASKSTGQNVVDGVFAIPLFLYRFAWGIVLVPVAETIGSASVKCDG